MPETPHLDRVKSPEDLRSLSVKELKKVAEELRAETVDAVSVTGGHLGAGLGVVELTVALHHVFDTPRDRLIWDVGHQSYPHKIITGRRDKIRTIRQPGGLYGFTKRTESEFDPFGAAHSSTSISAGLGMAGGDRPPGRIAQRDLRHRRRRHVWRHGLRGDEQCGLDAAAAHRHPQRQRDVDCAGGGRAQRLSLAAAVEPPVPQPARTRQAMGTQAAQGDGRCRHAGRGIFAGHGHWRHPLRGTGLLLYRPHRRPQSGAPDPGAAQRAQGRDAGAGAAPRRHQQGQGLRACGECAGPRPCPRQV